MGRGIPSHPTRGYRWSVASSLSWVRGRAPAKNSFYCNLIFTDCLSVYSKFFTCVPEKWGYGTISPKSGVLVPLVSGRSRNRWSGDVVEPMRGG